ncbi:MAG: hypothetical protein U0800_23455 [Isosphaeraceae bacterium]
MSDANAQLDAGGLLLPGTRVDEGASEPVVARTYRHPALGDRPVIRLASERLGQAEDLAMEFLGFGPPSISTPIALQQRRSLGFAEWALINDPGNARFALDLVKRMKAAARLARSKPGHAWDAYSEMAKELGRSARHFLPPFWEEAGRAFKDLGNPTYAGRSLNKSLEAERVHALASDRARRRDVVLEFVLSGCLSGNALSDYGNDLLNHSEAGDAFAIFRDLCVRRTRGGMAPWASMPKDFAKLAKAAGLDADRELEAWLEEVVDAPAMGRPPIQFWKACGAHCKRIVARSPEFAMALLRHTRPEPRYWGGSTQGPWLESLEEWGVLEFLWEDALRGAPPLGEPVAVWFGRIVRDAVPALTYTLRMLENLAPRLKREGVPIPLSVAERYRSTPIDIDVLETCFALGIPVADPPKNFSVTFSAWMLSEIDHPFRNRDVVESARDERFQPAIAAALDEALTCKGGTLDLGYRQVGLSQRAFPAAAGDRPGILALWHRQALGLVEALEGSGLASFEIALERFKATFWPETVRLFPDVAERLRNVDLTEMARRTLRAGVFDEYGLPALEGVVESRAIQVRRNYNDTSLYLTFPTITLCDKAHAYVIGGDGGVKRHELRLPKKCDLMGLVALGDDLAVSYRDDKYKGHLFWTSNRAEVHEAESYSYHLSAVKAATPLGDGSYFMGRQAVRPGDKVIPASQAYLGDGVRFWRVDSEYDGSASEHRWKVVEVDPRTGKEGRESVPPWFEEVEGGDLVPNACELMLAPTGVEDSPLGSKDGMLGWKAIRRRDGCPVGVGIDGRRWDKPLRKPDGSYATPVGLLRQPSTGEYLPITCEGGRGDDYWLWDPEGSTIVATLTSFDQENAEGQPTILPIVFWHLLKVRDEVSSGKLRAISREECSELFRAAAEDRQRERPAQAPGKEPTPSPLDSLLPAVKKLLPKAPERLAIGVARVIERAEARASEYSALVDKAAEDPAGRSIVEDRRADLAAKHWGLRAYHIYGHEGTVSVGANMGAAAAFLKGEAKAGPLPRTDCLWFPMLENLPTRAWGTYWRVQAAKLSKPGAGDVPWLEFLELWHGLGIAELPGRLDLMEGYPEGAKKRSWGGYDVDVAGGKSFAIQNGEDRFIVVENESYNQEDLPYQFLRHSTAEKPGAPPGYQVKNVRAIRAKTDPAEIVAFLEAAGACTRPPLPSRAELERTAANLSVSPAEVGLVWLAGLNLDAYENNFLPSELRKELGLKASEASVARQALLNLEKPVLESLFASVVSGGCAAPFSDDRAPVFRRIEEAWRSRMPRRLHLDAELQARLSVLGRSSRWHRVEHGDLLAAAADPSKHALLQPRVIEVGLEKDRTRSNLGLLVKGGKGEPTDNAFLPSIVQLVAIIHAETPAGHPARAQMPALIDQAARLLDNPGLLLPLREIHLYESDSKKSLKPSEWLEKHVGKTKDDAKAGIASLDDGLVAAAALDGHHTAFLAFRPANLKDPADLARLDGLMAIDTGDGYEVPSGAVPTAIALRSPGFRKLAAAILAEGVPPGGWPQNPLHTAPAVVKAIRSKFPIGEDAAVLYAQLLALPDPTAANLSTWNGWTSARLKKASAELAACKLVLEASRARAGRGFFLPGEWVELKAPWLPIERWKLAHLVDLDVGPADPCPAGGPLVLRPFEDLFAAAWQRVVDGDEPGYEQVKRKKKTK